MSTGDATPGAHALADLLAKAIELAGVATVVLGVKYCAASTRSTLLATSRHGTVTLSP